MNELNPNLNKANKEVTMELNFIKSGDYYIPDIKIAEQLSGGGVGGDSCQQAQTGNRCLVVRTTKGVESFLFHNVHLHSVFLLEF